MQSWQMQKRNQEGEKGDETHWSDGNPLCTAALGVGEGKKQCWGNGMAVLCERLWVFFVL